MSLTYIRDTYGVPAKLGGRVRYLGGKDKAPVLGTITGFSAAHILVRLDGAKIGQPYHPTWKIDYLDDQGENIWSSPP